MINTERFILKPLLTSDVTSTYLSWLTPDNTNGYISYAQQSLSLEELKQYVKDREYEKNIVFLGIFNKLNGEHIGNLKYEPIDFKKQIAILGALVGNKSWRGKGVMPEAIIASAQWLKENKNIKKILLEVNKNNITAIIAYQKCGFVESNWQEVKEMYTNMVLTL